MIDDHQIMLRNNLVTRLFVDIADQDYVLARFSFQKRFYHAFFWNAAQAVEKYLKACLLLNGGSARGYGHDLQRLYSAVEAIAGEFLPTVLEEPNLLIYETTPSYPPRRYLDKLEKFGGPDGRYNIFGYAAQTSDLVLLDRLVWSIRRIAFPLNAYPFLGPRKSGVPQTIEEMLRKHEDYCPRTIGSKLHKLMEDGSDETIRDAATTINFAFAPDDQDGRRYWQGSSFSNPPLVTEILNWPSRNLRTDQAQAIAGLAKWANEAMQLPQAVREQIKDAERQLRGQ